MTDKRKSTRDIYLSALFLALGAEYDGSDKTDPKHIEFFFKPRMAQMASDSLKIPTLDLDAVESQWVNGNVPVNAVAYSEAIKRMKSIVHSK